MTFVPIIGECPVCHRSSEEFLTRPTGEADRITSLEAKLADWERRSESCESKLGQLEANEQVIALEAKVRELEAGKQEQAIDHLNSLGVIVVRNKELAASMQQVERLVGCLTRMSAIPWGNYEATKPYRDVIDEALLAIEQETKEQS